MLSFIGNFAGPDLLVCPFCGFFLLGTVFWVFIIIDIVQKEPSTGNDKIIWLLIVLFLHWLGALIYFLVRRPERIRKYGS